MTAVRLKQDRLKWEELFVLLSRVMAKRSKHSVKSGACLVDETNKIIGMGYNGLPKGCDYSHFSDVLESSDRKTIDRFLCSEVTNVIQNRITESLEYATLYLTHFPSNEAVKDILQNKIKKVYYLSKGKLQVHSRKAAEDMLDKAGVFCDKPVRISRKSITVDLEEGGKHNNRGLNWDDCFMLIAAAAGLRSKDPNTQVGACIVNDRRVVGLGYNGFPRLIQDNAYSWARKGKILETKYPYVCHSELNAIHNSVRSDTEGATMYVSLFPCDECAKRIIQAGIKEVVFLSDKYKGSETHDISERLLNEVGIKQRHIVPEQRKHTFRLY